MLPGDLPLEVLAERRPVPFVAGADPVSLDLRLALGRRWLKLIRSSLRDEFIQGYPIRLPDPDQDSDTPLAAHADVWATVQAVAGRAMDGYGLYRHLIEGGRPYDGLDISQGHHDDLDDAAQRFVAWFQDLITQPPGAGGWDPSRLEHRFEVAVPSATGEGERVLSAREYPGGRLDWHSFSHDPDAPPLGAAPAAATLTRTVIPAPVHYSGMPHPRWWAFEDPTTNFGAVTPDTTDLARLLFCEFALQFSNDWFLLPCDLPAGTLAGIQGLAITDVFGQRQWITAAGAGDEEKWQQWTLYNLDILGDEDLPRDTSLFLAPTLPHVGDGPPLEEVLLIRDENANLVWGVERMVPVATGTGRRGAEVAAETLAHRRRLAPAAPPAEPAAPISYQVMNTVPENWIPFIPVRVPGDSRSIQLQRGALLRDLPSIPTDPPATPAKVRPRTSLLREGLDLDGASPQPYLLHEEEVTRAGTRLTVGYHRTRWAGGRVVVWLGAHRQTGRGEGSSRLAFDRLIDTSNNTP